MIKDEEYIGFLKSIISCISHGDYYSVKELSNLELERMKKIQKEKEKNRYIYWYISFFCFGEPGGIRTPDPRLRRPVLYPTELLTHYLR